MTKIDSPARAAAAVVLAVILNALVMLGFSQLLDSFTLDGPVAALGTALVLGLVNGGLIYATSRLPLRLGVFAIGALLLGVNLIAIVVAGLLVTPSWETAIAIAYTGGGMALATGLLIWLFSIGEEPGEPSRSERSGRTAPDNGRHTAARSQPR
jgi:uncharacterized membrane protein YvlD (DUF360 family)